MLNKTELAWKVAGQAQSLLGDLYDENNQIEFRKHLFEMLRQDDETIEKRISLLFAIWSNINIFSDKIEVNSLEFLLFSHLKDRKFSIVCELAVLCRVVVRKIFGSDLIIKNNEQQENFKNMLSEIDKICRAEKRKDVESLELLINTLGAYAINQNAIEKNL